MNNRYLILGAATLAIIVALIFFSLYATKRGGGIYTSQTYSGCYETQDRSNSELIMTAQPGDKLQVLNVDKRGWACIQTEEHGKLYTNYFGLEPFDVKYPVNKHSFYNGGALELILFQCLLWVIFLMAGVLLFFIKKENKKGISVMTTLLITGEILYMLIFALFIAPLDIVFGGAFDSALAVIVTFICNMAGLILLGLAHKYLITKMYSECRQPTQPVVWRILSIIQFVFIAIFSIYIAVRILMMTLMLIVIAAAVTAAVWAISLISDFENSHVSGGRTDYEYDTLRGTARKKKLFEL